MFFCKILKYIYNVLNVLKYREKNVFLYLSTAPLRALAEGLVRTHKNEKWEIVKNPWNNRTIQNIPLKSTT